MTTKEIAQAVGKTERSVRNWVQALAEKSSAIAEKSSASTSTHPASYDLDETISIIEHGMGKNAALLYRQNATQHQSALTTLSPKDIDIIGAIVAGVIQKLDARVSAIESRFEERAALLPPPEMPIDAQIRELVNAYAARTGTPYHEVWNKLYSKHYYLYHTNLTLRAKNAGVKPTIKYALDMGHGEELLGIAVDLFVEE